MRQLKTRKFTLPRFFTEPLRLSPVPSEDDELIRAIEAEKDVWQLEATPDTGELHRFWSSVEEDLKQDPTWFSFTDDE